MCKSDGGEILSNIELVLPWNVVNTCYHLEKEGQSCFLALNGEENTSSQITVKKQSDDSVKITVTVMALTPEEKGGQDGAGGDTEEEEEEDDEEEDEEEPRGRRSPRKDDSPSRSPRKGTRSSGSPSGNIFEKMGGAGGSTSKIAKLRQQRKASPASEAARKLIHSLDDTPKRKKGRGKRNIKCEEDSDAEEARKSGNAVAESADSTEESSSQNKDTPIVTYEKKGRGKRQRPIYMPDPKKRKGAVEEEEEEEDEEVDDDDDYDDEEPQIEIENHGGSTIIIVKQTEEGGKGKRGRRQQPLKKRWSEMHAKEATGREHEMFRDPYDLDMPDDGIGVQKNIIQPSNMNKRRRTTAFPGTPMKKRSLRDGDIECKFCDAKVVDHAYLYRHARKMHSDEPDLMPYLDELRPLVQFPCSFCHEVFDENATLYEHMKEAHQDCITIAEYRCPECDKKFKTSGAYQRHMVKAHGDNPDPEDDELNCSLCSKTFPTESQLSSHHKTTHDAAEMYECDVCHKFYNTKGKLRRHRLIHGEFRFFCSYCNKGFHMRDNMNKHIRIMHESYETPQNECPHCGKTFLVKGNLTQHIKGVHLKQFAFNCSRCNMGFHRIKNLQQHLDICMGEAMPTRPPRTLKMEKGRESVGEEEMEDEGVEEGGMEEGAEEDQQEKHIQVSAANTIVVAPEVVTAVVETEDGQITQEDALRIMEMAIESTQEA